MDACVGQIVFIDLDQALRESRSDLIIYTQKTVSGIPEIIL